MTSVMGDSVCVGFMAASTAKSKFPNWHTPIRSERYQIYSLAKADQTISVITQLLGRKGNAISHELERGFGQRGYRAEQARTKPSERALRSQALISKCH